MLDKLAGKGSLDDVIKDKGITATRDPRRVSQMQEMAVGHGSLHVCEVHDVLAYANSYIIKAAGMPHMPACLLSATSSFLPLGGRDCATIMPGSLVLCMIDVNLPMALIIGVLPTVMGGPNLGLPDSIVAAGHAGLFTDSVHNGALNQKSGHGFVDLSAGRPVDSLPGDWGYLNELGVGVFIGKLLSFLRAGDFCKFEVNYEDQLARIAAMNMEVFTSGSEAQAFNDEGEWTDIRGFNPYPWEAMGVVRDQTPFRETGAELKGDNEEFGLEPQESTQTGIWRFRTFDGFLGDLRRNVVVAPTEEMQSIPMSFERENTPYYGLLDERYGVDGSYRLRSAKSIGFEKTIFIPVPFERYPRDNPNGNTAFEDPAGQGADYNMSEIPEAEVPSEAVAGAPDKHAYENQHLHQEGLNLRDKDWGVEDPPKLPGGWDTEQDTLKPYSTYESPMPVSEEIEVDHRGNRRYYKSKAFWDILEDGSIIFQDAYGSSIKMTGGNIEFSCPGSIVHRPGRDMVVMSGQDIIAKANRDVDVSSASGSVRMKAEVNFMILGGNDGARGGVLVENRASGTPNFEAAGESVNIGGLMLKSAAGDTTIWGRNVNLQSLNGDIVMDANEGTRDIICYAASHRRYATTNVTDMVSKDGTEDTADANVQYQSLSAAGYSLVTNSINLAGTVLTIMPRNPESRGGIQLLHYGNGVVRGAYASTRGFSPVASLKDAEAKTFMQPIMNSTKDQLTSNNSSAKERSKQDRGPSSTYLGTSASLRVGVNFRLTSEIGISQSFVLYQTEWQKAFDLIGGGGKFTEKTVYAFTSRDGRPQGTQTMPYPGREAWEDQDHFGVNDGNEYINEDANGSAPKPRTDDAYESAKGPTFTKKTLQGNYTVNNPMSTA